MSDLHISGGAGGFDARMVDLQAYGGRLRDEGGQVLGLAGPVAREGSEELAEAMLLAPELVPVVLARLGEAEASILSTGGALVATGTVVDTAVEGYRTTDAMGRDLLSQAQIALGFGAGLLVPAAALTTALAALPVLASNPTLRTALEEYVKSGRMSPDLQKHLYDHPEELEALTRLAPGLVQGTTTSLAGIASTLALGPGGGPLGPLVLSGLSGGRWPTTDYEDAVAGLDAIAGHGGLLQDSGDFELDTQNARVTSEKVGGVEDLLTMQNRMNQLAPEGQGQLRVVTVTGADGTPALVVQVPGTEEWSPKRGDNPVDLSTNTQAMAGADTVMKQKVAEAIRMAQAELPPGTPVMLTGHSQGGIVAATLASDPALVKELNIRSLVTAGSPIARMPVDSGVSVLSLEHTQDAVPMLDGAENPPSANWVTVRRELPPDGGNAAPDLAGAHDLGKNYTATGAMVDRADDPSVADWKRRNAAFFGQGQSVTYPIVRK